MTKLGVYSALFWLGPILLAASTPTVTYGTFFGGTGDSNVATAVAVDTSGNVIVVGYTTSQTLWGTANTFQPTKAAGLPIQGADNTNAFIAKFDPTGKTLLWATFLGGDTYEAALAVAVDPTGNIYITGASGSSNLFRTAIACLGFQLTCSIGPAAPASSSPAQNSFVAKVSPNGTQLLYCIGILGTQSTALAVTSLGEVFVATAGYGAAGDLFLFHLNAAGSALVFGAVLAIGPIGSSIGAISVGPQGNYYLGGSEDVNMPTTSNAFQGSNPNLYLNGDLRTGFVLEFNPPGSQLIYGTWFGPEYSTTTVSGLAANSDGSLYFAGSTNATALQATSGAFQNTPASGYIAKLTPGSPTLDSFSYLPSRPLGLAVGNQPQTAYLLLLSQIIELNVPTLSLASSLSLPEAISQGALTAAALAPPHSLWLVGSCGPCSLGSLISANTSFQTTPQNPSSSAVLIQVADVTPPPSTITAVLDAASYSSGAVSPGEIVSIFGTSIGPTAPAYLALDSTGKVSTSIGGVTVSFSGYPAPLTYVGATQINAIVPYEIAGNSSPFVEVAFGGQTSNAPSLQLAATAPGIFTQNSSGTGPGAILDGNSQLNTQQNPAAKGSIIQIFLTGEGSTNPAQATGAVTPENLTGAGPLTPVPQLAVSVLIGGQPAQVIWDGEAPYLVAGVLQVDAVVPATVSSGANSITVQVGNQISQAGVTVWVQ
jgi:uncharacterized protein (TIGR03437 family)